MKARTLFIFAALVLASLVGWTVYAQRSRSVATTWEYHVMLDPAIESFRRSASFTNGVKELNLIGSEGWEIIGVNNTEHGVMLYLKRAK